MPGANGDFIQGYNAQAVVEQDSHMVVATHVSQATNDKQEMEPALNELKKVLGKPEVLVADAGYHSKENVRCVEQDIEPYIAGSRERHNQALEDRINAPPECPADADAVTAKHRLQTAEGKAIYSKRKSTVETVFGVIKEVLGSALSSARVTRRRGRMESGVHGVESEAAVCPGRRISGVSGSRWTSCGAGTGAGDTLQGVAGITIPPEQPQSLPKALFRHPTVRYRARVCRLGVPWKLAHFVILWDSDRLLGGRFGRRATRSWPIGGA